MPQHPQIQPSDSVAQCCLCVAGILLTFAFAVFVLDSLTLICGGTVGAWQGWLGFALGSLYALILYPPKSQHFFWSVSIALGLVALSLLISGLIQDTSWDGQTYHQEALLQFAQGWNPLYQSLTTANGHSIWLNHYPRASWLLSSTLFQMTDRLETAKAFNSILLFSSFLLTFGVIRSITALKRLQSGAIAGLFALNPIVMTQLFNFTIDGQIASLLLILGVALYWISIQDNIWTAPILLALFSTTLLINLKFTGLIYAVIFLGGTIAWLIYRRHRSLYRLAVISAVCVVVSVAGLGFNPYISNVLTRGNPFYPLAGDGKVDIISPHIPVSFAGKTSVEKFLLSTFAATDDALKATVHLKPPFYINRNEIGATGRGARLGGFGPLFSGAVCFGLVVLVCSSIVQFPLGYFAAFVILASTLINPEAWWARYAPQAWMLMPLAVLPGLTRLKPMPRRKLLRFCSAALILVLTLNCAMAALPYTYQSVRSTLQIHQQLRQLAGGTIAIWYNTFGGNRMRLAEAGIETIEVADSRSLPCKDPLTLVSSQAQFCPVPQAVPAK